VATASDARERWVLTELRRQAVTTESALREVSERIDQLSRTLRQMVDYLPRLNQRIQGASGGGGPGSAANAHFDAVLSRRIDELEARIEARFDEVAGAAATVKAAGGRIGGPPPIDLATIRAQIKDEMAVVTKQFGQMGDRMRAELVTAAGQAEARLNRDRDQLRDVLNKTTAKLNDLVGGTVSRDELRQYWVEMAARLAKHQEVLIAEREQLRLDLSERLDQIAGDREQLRLEVGERLARVAEATAATGRGAAADTKPLAAARAAQKAALDELRRDVHQLGAQLLAATNPKNRPPAVDAALIETLRQSMAQAAAALSSAASKDDVEALRNQLAGTVTRLERAIVSRVQEDEHRWDEHLAAALEAVQLTVEGAELNRRAVLSEVSAAVRAALGGVLPPLPTS
jgi:DNA repair exonuclease SbcCD ATPase subunit